jgi:hypothetical protein
MSTRPITVTIQSNFSFEYIKETALLANIFFTTPSKVGFELTYHFADQKDLFKLSGLFSAIIDILDPNSYENFSFKYEIVED